MNRIKSVACVFAVVGIALIIHFFVISIIYGEELTKNAVAQRTNADIVSNGTIYDRNMIVIDNKHYVNKNDKGIMNHIIGYTSQNGTGYGIKGAFYNILSSAVGSSKKGVALTIDYHIQKIAEEVMDKHQADGAAVVLDIKSGEVLAMASRPDFNRHNVAKYLDSQNGELINRAICEYNPGSVFKIVVAAAALEGEVSEDTELVCNGYSDIGGMRFVCHRQNGHGAQNMYSAFANSCNCAFYKIGADIGAEKIQKYARAFGIGAEVLKINGIVEAVGNAPLSSSVTETANISIGQGDVMLTPLQMADILCTICNGGVRRQITLIKGTVDENGRLNELLPSDIGTVISEASSRRLMNMLRLAVTDGTGKNADIPIFGAGGKTGSAETGWKKNGELMKQGWFAGFFPSESPEYICVVMAENGKSGSEAACPIFRDIGIAVCDLVY